MIVEPLKVVEQARMSLIAHPVNLVGSAPDFHRGERSFPSRRCLTRCRTGSCCKHAVIRHELLELLAAILPGLNRPSQHQPDLIAGARRGPPQESSTPASCAVYRSAWQLPPEVVCTMNAKVRALWNLVAALRRASLIST